MEFKFARKSKLIILMGLGLTFFCQQHAFAADSTINITANIVASPCTPETVKNVVIPDINATTLASPGSWTGSTSFTIELTNCPATTTSVVSTYSGTAMTETPTLFAGTGTAKNAGAQLKVGGTGTVLSNGSSQTTAVNATTHAASVKHDVYILNGSKTAAVTPGTFSSTISVTFTYK